MASTNSDSPLFSNSSPWTVGRTSTSTYTGSSNTIDGSIRGRFVAGSISRASISRSGTTRPTTSMGRKSRATTASSVLGIDTSQNIICAVSEARGVTPSVGVAFVNASVGEVTLSQICDNQSYVKTIHKIQMMSPSRIIFMSTACPPNRPSTLFSLTNQLVQEAHIDAFDRSAWSEISGLEYIQELAFQEDLEPIKVAIAGKYYATTSFGAVCRHFLKLTSISGLLCLLMGYVIVLRKHQAMKYIEQNFTITFVPHSLRINYQPSDDTMMIDISAFQSLEIMQNLRNSKSKDCLFGLLNNTMTPMGARMLRSNMLQPPTQQDNFITPRYDALEELTTNEEMFRHIRKALKEFRDVEKILTKLITISTATDVPHVEEQINQILMIKSFLEAVPELYRALIPVQSALLLKIRDLCHPDKTGKVLQRIQQVIEADVTFMKSALDARNQRTFAVKAGISGILDVARQTYKELTEEIHCHVDEIRDQHRMGISLQFDNSRKYWLRIRAGDLEEGQLPDIFINVVQKKDKIQCQTLDLVKLNLRLSDTCNEVVIRSDSVIHDLVEDLRREASDLFRVCESVALIDMISSFGQLVTTRDYVRPEIAGTLALKSARHPILDQKGSSSFVPNDYYATEQYCFHIVTGCNMSGKSTYIKTAALLQIMAQVGCFVPAEYAAFPIIHHIFARVSMDDNIESNLSTFSVEMREMAFILRNIDQKSLAIVDELGRGTSTRDGLAIAIAISEALIQSKASVWFATHFVELAHVLAERSGVLNLHLSAKSSITDQGIPEIVMLYKVASGNVDEEEHYGINLARAIGLPKEFTQKALEVAKNLRSKRESNKQDSESRKVMARRKLILHLHETLKQVRDSTGGQTTVTLSRYLSKVQEEFIARMEDANGA